jgi:hypothetical protein
VQSAKVAPAEMAAAAALAAAAMSVVEWWVWASRV